MYMKGRIPFLVMLFAFGALPHGTMTAQTPEASPAASPVTPVESAWRIADRREIEVDGQPVALSPDGQWIAGTGSDGVGICAWEIVSLDPTCAGNDVRPDRSSIVWSPDSSAIAFTDGSIREPEPNSLWLFSVVDGALTMLDGREEPTRYTEPDWTPDSQRIVFGRTQPPGAYPQGSDIAYVDRDGGDPQTVSIQPLTYVSFEPAEDDLLYIFAVANAINPDPQAPADTGIWRVRFDGTGLEQIPADEDIPELILVQLGTLSPDERTLLVWGIERPLQDRVAPAPFLLNLASGELEPVTAVDGSRILWGSSPFAPDASSAAVLTYDDASDTVYLQTLDVKTGETHHVVDGALEPWEDYWFVSWEAGNQVLIATDTSTVLLTLEQAM